MGNHKLSRLLRVWMPNWSLLIFSLQTHVVLQKYQLHYLNHVHIWQVSLQLSCRTPVKYELCLFYANSWNWNGNVQNVNRKLNLWQNAEKMIDGKTINNNDHKRWWLYNVLITNTCKILAICSWFYNVKITNAYKKISAISSWFYNVKITNACKKISTITKFNTYKFS